MRARTEVWGLVATAAAACGYIALVPAVYVVNPGLQTSVALLVGLSIAAPIQTVIGQLLKAWRKWRGTLPHVDTVEDRLARIEHLLTTKGAG